jgi:uncharacterized membrane protein
MSVRSVSRFGLVAQALATSALMSLCLFVYAVVFKSGSYYFYLIWNLFLAALPLLFAVLLVRISQRGAWSSWKGIGLTLLWLGFLPNSFYMVTDYIHLQEIGAHDLLYYVVMFTSFILSGLLFGYTSLYLVHLELRKRLPTTAVARSLLGLIVLCSFAIYLGRDLRWNTWDILLNPGGLLFDISERFLSPAGYPDMFETTASFTVLISGTYFVIWRFSQALAGRSTSVILDSNERPTHSSSSRRRP